MKKLLIIGLVLLIGCAQANKTDVGKSETDKLVKSCIGLCFQVLEGISQGDKHYIDGCDTYVRARTPEEWNTVIKHLTKANQYYSTAEQTLRKMPSQENEQIDEIYSLLLNAIGENIDSVSLVRDASDQIINHPMAPVELPPGNGTMHKKHLADDKLIKAWNKIRELIGDKEENKEQHLPPNIVQYIDTLKERLDLK